MTRASHHAGAKRLTGGRSGRRFAPPSAAGSASRCHGAPSAPHGVKVFSRDVKTGIASLLAALTRTAPKPNPRRLKGGRIAHVQHVTACNRSIIFGPWQQMVPGILHKVSFERFRALVTKWRQEGLRRLSLRILGHQSQMAPGTFPKGYLIMSVIFSRTSGYFLQTLRNAWLAL